MFVSRAIRAAVLCALLAASAPSAAQTPLPYDREITATIMASDQQLADGSFYQEWSFAATAGMRVVITMRSTRFDSALYVGRYAADGEWETLAMDDDSGGGRDAELAFTIPVTGEYRVRANTLNSNQTGNYTLLLSTGAGITAARPEAPRRAAAAPASPAVTTPASRIAAPPPRAITLREEVTSSLDESDATVSDGSFFEYWSFTAVRGQRYQILMRSEALDAFLTIGTLDDAGFHQSLSNDDGAGDTDALLVFTAPRDGEFVIRANSVSPREVGEYTLLVQRIL
jgi:hypothetical protein